MKSKTELRTGKCSLCTVESSAAENAGTCNAHGARATALHSHFDCRAQRRRSLWHKRTMLGNFPMAGTKRSNEMIAHGPVHGHLAWWNRTVSLHRRESTDQLLKQESTTQHATLFTQIIDVNCKKRTKLTGVASTLTAACAVLCKGLDVWLAELIYMKHDFFPKILFSLFVFSHAAGYGDAQHQKPLPPL